WLFKRTRSRHSRKFKKWKSLALIVLVAIPLPMTGAWTGSIAAFIFGISYFKALGLIFLGVVIAGLIVTLASMGTLNILRV
ncbi:MAG: ligand-binding protein SH3, partial [Parcubacteria group bacterium CG_4_10_14_0_8_um_filter_35_7]